MNLLGKILIIDDDPAFLRTYHQLLGAEGYEVHEATDRGAAMKMLDEADWDLVLLDLKLKGSGGPDEGLDLLAEIQARSPFARTILVTAYPSPETVQRAFLGGVYDYLEKNELFSALLRSKARNATELSRERKLLAAGQATLSTTWKEVREERDRNRKGALLEQLLAMLMRSIPGFSAITPRRRNEVEEIDLVIRNESTDPFWSNEGSYILVECKNWSSRVGAPEVREFRAKIEERHNRCRLGFLVAPGGFADTFAGTQARRSTQDPLIVPIDGNDLDQLVSANPAQRSEQLKRLHEKAVLAGNGHS